MLASLACSTLVARAGQASEVRPPLRLAMSGAFQPFSTTNERGELVGFDADIARALAERMGREPVLVQVDWAGTRMRLTDPISRRTTNVSVFVATLPYSGLVFAHGYLDEKLPAWLDAHRRAFEYFGGVPLVIVPDNASTASNHTSNSRRGSCIGCHCCSTLRSSSVGSRGSQGSRNAPAGDARSRARALRSARTSTRCARGPSSWHPQRCPHPPARSPQWRGF